MRNTTKRKIKFPDSSEKYRNQLVLKIPPGSGHALPSSSELAPSLSSAGTAVWLWRVVMALGKEDDPWFLHYHAVCFKNAVQQKSWKSVQDVEDLDTYQQYIDSEMDDTIKYKIGLFITWAAPWMEADYTIRDARNIEGWAEAKWHSWVAVLEEVEYGWRLYIWDCDAATRFEGKEVVTLDDLDQRQRGFVLWLNNKKEERSCSEIYIGGSMTGKQGSMAQSGQWILDSVKGGGADPGTMAEWREVLLEELAGEPALVAEPGEVGIDAESQGMVIDAQAEGEVSVDPPAEE